MLLSYAPQRSLLVGFVALILQTLAGVAGLFWASGCAQVFASPHPVGNCACFYQMPVFEAVAALISPVLLLKGTVDQFFLWVNTAVYGDCLYLQMHKIPHHVERAAMSWREGHLMVWPLELSKQVKLQPPHPERDGFVRMVFRICWLLVLWAYMPMLIASVIGGSVSKLKALTADKWLLDLVIGIVPAIALAIGWIVLCLLDAFFAVKIMRMLKERVPWVEKGQPRKCQTWFYPCVVSAILLVCNGEFLWHIFAGTFGNFWPPRWLQDLPERERAVLDNDLMSLGLSSVISSAVVPAVFALFVPPLRLFLTLMGHDQMTSATSFLSFARMHQNLIQSFPHLEKLLREAEDDPYMEESAWQLKVKIWLASIGHNRVSIPLIARLRRALPRKDTE